MIPFLKDIRNDNVALYLNFPFCVSPCSYCHYIQNIKFGQSIIPKRYFETICEQLIEVCSSLPHIHYKSIYFGGGTPSLLTDSQIETIFKIFNEYNITSDEISMELHPHYCNFNYETNKYITRYSVAVQAFDDTLLKDYRRNGYSYENITHIVHTLRNNPTCQNINIDLIFDDHIPSHTSDYLEKLQPDTATIYPNTKGRGVERLVSVRKSLLEIRKQFTTFKLVAKSNFIFVKRNSVHSQYSKIEYETFGDIIGLGHNSVSLIGDTSYLTLYENESIKIKNRENKGSRYLSAFLGSLPVGVTYESVCNFMPELKTGNYLFTVENDADINEKHTKISGNSLVYLPDSEYIRFINNILPNYTKYTHCFLFSIGFGDENIATLTTAYNYSLVLDNIETNELIDSLKLSGNFNKKLYKLCLPNKKILVEGIDGSGKDTFVQLLSNEIKKRFSYNSDCTISVLGQPDSHLKFGHEAKKFVEDLEYTDITQVITALKCNRQQSEARIQSLNGIQILIRGIVTELATLNIAFGDASESDIENENPCEWDYYIVVKTDPLIADERIQKRGIPRTWRETPEFLRIFSDYYLSFDSKRFNKKVIIENTSIANLKKAARKLANEIYAEEYNRKPK